MTTRRWTATLIGLALVSAIVALGLAGAVSAKPPLTATTHSYVNGTGVVKHGTIAAVPKHYRALVKRAFARTRSLQASGASQTCLGGTKDNDTAAVQTCTVQGSAGACIQISSDPGATQTCTFTQPAGRTNLAVVVQIIVQRNGSPTTANPDGSPNQSGSQSVTVRQKNATKPNLSFVTQIIKQSLGRGADNADSEISDQASPESAGESQGTLPDFSPLIAKLQSVEPQQEGDETPTTASSPATVSQTQQSQQTINVCQGGPVDCTSPAGTTSTNLSSVYQSLRQRERWSNASVLIDQHQNHNPGTCPSSGGPSAMCAIVDENTTGGKNFSGLVELYRQFQSGRHTASLTQEQNPSGLSHTEDHDIRQTSIGSLTGPKRNTIFTDQRSRFVQRAVDATVLHQLQDPDARKGPDSFQFGTLNDTWNGTQISTQLQFRDGIFNPSGFQVLEMAYDGDSDGTINVFEQGTQNAKTHTEQCPGAGSSSSCHISVDCFHVEGNPPCTGTPNPIPDSVIGSGTIGGDTFDTGRSFVVNAAAHPDDTSPRGTLLMTFNNQTYHGDVSQGCILVNGDTATVVGKMPESEWFVNGDNGLLYQYIELNVLDDGTPIEGQPVDSGRAFFITTNFDTNPCLADLPPLDPLSAGDVTVVDAPSGPG
jgi:hypothetical protein